MPEFTRHEIQLLADYHEMTTDVMHMIFPQLTRMELGMAIDDAIKQYLENPNVLINNSYKHVEVKFLAKNFKVTEETIRRDLEYF